MSFQFRKYIFAYLFLFIFFQNNLSATTGRYRCMWREHPATTMTIGWEQMSGNNSIVYYDELDGGQASANYSFSQKANRKVWAKGMHNYFARLTHLKPNTVYYFIIKDSEGVSARMSFKTAPDNPYERLSIIAGGDSRNHRKARCNANLLVSKLRPHAVMFGGDMTGGDIERQWKAWLDDWQKTITPDGHLTPIIATRGNHESSNKSLVDLFDLKNSKNYYAFNLGGNLLRIYTLNSMIAAGGDQRDWLENDLRQNTQVKWKFVQYHHAIRPHMSRKSNRNAQLKNWATLFYKYGVDLACESDSHVAKTTYPIRPSRERGSQEGFIRDDEAGTVYVGEGCWGAPLRRNDDDKSWTRASGSFNQFKWIFIDMDGIEIRTIKVDNASQVESVSAADIFSEPYGLEVWSPPTGRVLHIGRRAILANYDHASPSAKTNFDKTTPNQQLVSKPPLQRKKNTIKRKKLKPTRVVNVKPLEIQAFEAKVRAQEVTVQWTTRNEYQMPTFEIQRSMDGRKYTTFARIKGNGRNAKKENFYKIKDNLTSIAKEGFPKYRLRHILSNGQVMLVQAKTEVLKSSPKWNIHEQLKTNPQTGQIQFKYKLEKPADVSVKLVNIVKKQVLRNDFKKAKSGNFLQSLDVSQMANGEYLLIIEANQKVIQQYKVEI